MMTLLGAVAAAVVAWGVVRSAPGHSATAWPVPGPVIEEFDPPFPDWQPGHRGIDVASPLGTAVRTPRDGVIRFAGRVAGTPVVVIDHGVIDSTYLPATTTRAVGEPVSAGADIGRTASGIHCTQPCLHWGARANGRYVDPRVLLGRYRIVLTPVTD